MYMIEISEHKMEKMSGYVEDALHAMGKVMSCLSEFDGYGERGGRYGSRGGYGSRYDSYGSRGSMGYKDDEWDDDEPMGERRGRRRDSMGRFR